MAPTAEFAAFTDQALLDLLASEEDRVPRAAVDEILRRGPSMAPRLVEILEDEHSWNAALPRWWAVVHAAYLLAALQPPGALDVLIEALEHADEFEVEWITAEARSLLGSFGPPAIPALTSLALDPQGSESFRSLLCEALARIGHQHVEVRGEVLPVLRQIASDEFEESDVRAFAGCLLLDFALPEDRELVLSVADGWFFTRKHAEEIYDLHAPPRTTPSDDWMEFYEPARIAERQEHWKAEDLAREQAEERPPMIQNKGATLQDLDLDPGVPLPEDLSGSIPEDEILPTPIRAEPKPGRNDPCPCGSGKKYKKCCGR